MRLRILTFGIFVSSLLAQGAVCAQDVNVLKELDFGEAVVRDNLSQRSIIVQTNGSFSADSAFIILQNPTEGLYQVTNLPPSTVITSILITVDQQMIGPGEDFIIDNFDIDAPSSSNSNGELDISVGARLRTTGSGQNYLYDAQFESALTLEINY